MSYQQSRRWSDDLLAATFKFLVSVIIMTIAWNLLKPYVMPSLVLIGVVSVAIALGRFLLRSRW